MTTTTLGSRDEHGNPITADRDAAGLYDRAIDAFVRFHPDVVSDATTLVEDHPDVALGHALMAYLQLMSTDHHDLGEARRQASMLDATAVDDRARGHASAVDAWLRGDWHRAARILDEVLVQWPTDLLALMIGHQLDFFVGDARNLRDRAARSLASFDPSHPHAAFVRGMLAFGLEEAGDLGLAEEAALAAIDVNRDDVWAIHAATHCYEMRGKVAQGTALLEERVADWGYGNLFTVHNWWHLALFRLEQGDIEGVLRIYDEHVHHAGSSGVPIEMLDASALLWRLRLDGVDVGDRWIALADAWRPKMADAVSWYVFNDVHALMAMTSSGRDAEARAIAARLEADAASTAPTSNRSMTVDAGRPAARAIVAFDEGRFDDAVAELWPHRRTLHHFGGSHAQRDVFERTLVEAAVRGSHHDLARRLVDERATMRPSGRFAVERRRALAEVPVR